MGFTGVLKKIVGGKAELVRDLSAAGGGAVGLFATAHVLNATDGLPIVGADGSRPYRQLALAVLEGRLAHAMLPKVPLLKKLDTEAFGCGLTGAVGGGAILAIARQFLGDSVVPALSEVLPTQSFGDTFSVPQIGPLDDTAQLPSASQLAEVLPEQQFAAVAGLGAQPVDVNSLGSWLGSLSGIA